MRTTVAVAIVAVLFWAPLFVVPARATTVLRTSMETMAKRSDVVLHARVGPQHVRWSDDGARILTLTELEVLTPLKGQSRSGDVVTVYQVGGTLDGTTVRVPGAARFVPGEELVFFGMRFGKYLVTYGMGLGKFRVEGVGSTRAVVPEYGDVAFVARADDGALVPAPAPDVQPEPLSEFVRRALRAASLQRGGDR